MTIPDGVQAAVPVPSRRAAIKQNSAKETSGTNDGSSQNVVTRDAPKLGDADLKQLLRTMMIIRKFETRTTDLFLSGAVKGTAHSSAGQEAIAAGACYPLLQSDFIATHHRGHGHCIAKGADVPRMMAECV